jgi:hypothetical protein
MTKLIVAFGSFAGAPKGEGITAGRKTDIQVEYGRFQ